MGRESNRAHRPYGEAGDAERRRALTGPLARRRPCGPGRGFALLIADMTAGDREHSALPLYCVCDRRRDGCLRVLAQYREPREALEHARTLRWAGDVVEVHLVTRFDEAAP